MNQGRFGIPARKERYQVYDPFCPPADPSPINDEFDTSGIGVPGNWTDVGALAPTIVVARGDLEMQCAGNAGANSAAIERVLPAGPFTVATHITTLASLNFNVAGLYVRSSVSGRFFSPNLFSNSAYQYGNTWLGVGKWTSFTARSSSASELPYYDQSVFLRLNYDGTNLSADFSGQGSHWRPLLTESIGTWFTGGNLPDRVGFILSSFNASNTPRAAWSFLRYFPRAFANIGRTVSREI